MTNNFVENIYFTSQHFEDVSSNTIDENPVNSHYHQSLLSHYSISEEYLLDNQNSNEISINLKDWLITDPISRKLRAPRQNEFLLLLLERPSYSSYISWLDKDQGLCKIHQPDQVATLWGKIKNRQTMGIMNYEIFARGIRFHYKSGLMIKTNKKHVIRFKLPLNTIS